MARGTFWRTLCIAKSITLMVFLTAPGAVSLTEEVDQTPDFYPPGPLVIESDWMCPMVEAFIPGVYNIYYEGFRGWINGEYKEYDRFYLVWEEDEATVTCEGSGFGNERWTFEGDASAIGLPEAPQPYLPTFVASTHGACVHWIQGSSCAEWWQHENGDCAEGGHQWTALTVFTIPWGAMEPIPELGTASMTAETRCNTHQHPSGEWHVQTLGVTIYTQTTGFIQVTWNQWDNPQSSGCEIRVAALGLEQSHPCPGDQGPPMAPMLPIPHVPVFPPPLP
jgi:hypothetical protein